MADEPLAQLVAQQMHKLGVAADDRLPAICGLFKDRCDTTVALAEWAAKFYTPVTPNPEEVAKHVVDGVRPAISMLARMLEGCPWEKLAITEAIKEVLRATGMKMPQLAMPVRVLVMGTAQTPSLDAVLALCDRDTVLERLKAA
jgi:glutamyl-tRNA synthetase